MKLGVMTVLLSDKSLNETLAYLKGLGVTHVELGCGGYPGNAHCNPVELLNDNSKFEEFKNTLKAHNMEISVFSVHGNPIHPQKEIAESFHRDFENAVLLAEKLGIDTVVTFSGCPGDSETSLYPNWVTCPWPEDFLKVLDWQWNDVLIPYWKKAAAFCKAHNVTKIAFEMHPGFCVYNPATLLRLRESVGDIIGANFDPSHLFWQGIDPCHAVADLKGAIYHFHAKDTKINTYNTAKNGVLDTKHFSKEAERSWIFRTVGYGHSEDFWKEMFSALSLAGYNGAISIEHEDSLMSTKEGLEKAVEFLKNTMIFDEKPVSMYWA
jgi:sugar phosphate isomerase/epimerase